MEQNQATQPKMLTSRFYIHMVIVIAAMIGIGCLPPFAAVTPFGMKILGIFVGCIIGWGLGYMAWPSLIALLVLSFMGENTVSGVFSQAYGNVSLLMVLFAMLYCFAISQTGIMQYVANWVLTRKFVAKGGWYISLAFWIACALCSALITNTLPVIILMWTMFYSVVEKLEVPRHDKWVSITMIMMCVVGYTGSVIMPFCPWAMMCYGLAQSTVPTLEIKFFAHVVLMLVLNTLIIAGIFLLCRFVLAPKAGGQVAGRFDLNLEKPKMTKKQKWGLFYLALLMALMFFPVILPAAFPFVSLLKALGATGAFVVCVVLMNLTFIDGEPLVDPMTAMRDVPWGLYFLLSAALLIAGLIAGEDTGIAISIVGLLNSTAGILGVFWVMVLFVFFGTVVTNLINNVVCINIFILIGSLLIVSLGGNPYELTALLLMVLYLGLATPSGSVVGALMHGNNEWLSAGAVYKYASLGCLVVVLVCCLVGIPLGKLLF
jgi:di/tricarboxylate transporter